MKQKYVFVLFVLLFYLLCGNSSAGATDQRVTFRWAFVTVTGSGKTEKLVPITGDTVLHSGDRFKMMVELQHQCFVYVLFRTTQGKILNLFPGYSSGVPKGSNNSSQKSYLPDSHSWFTLDQYTGIEKVYLLASHSRLNSLEKLLDDYKTASENAKEKLVVEIIALIKQSRKQHKRFAVTVERPIQIGGTFRNLSKSESTQKDIEAFAMDISGDGFFAKTFTIEHR